MSLFDAYLEEIENRKEQGLKPKPIDDGGLVTELVAQIKHADHEHRAASLDFLAELVMAAFLPVFLLARRATVARSAAAAFLARS